MELLRQGIVQVDELIAKCETDLGSLTDSDRAMVEACMHSRDRFVTVIPVRQCLPAASSWTGRQPTPSCSPTRRDDRELAAGAVRRLRGDCANERPGSRARGRSRPPPRRQREVPTARARRDRRHAQDARTPVRRGDHAPGGSEPSVPAAPSGPEGGGGGRPRAPCRQPAPTRSRAGGPQGGGSAGGEPHTARTESGPAQGSGDGSVGAALAPDPRSHGRCAWGPRCSASSRPRAQGIAQGAGRGRGRRAVRGGRPGGLTPCCSDLWRRTPGFSEGRPTHPAAAARRSVRRLWGRVRRPR